MLDWGVRADELSGLGLDDARMEDGHLRAKGKGGKEDLVSTGYKAQKALLRYRHRYLLRLGSVHCDFQYAPVRESQQSGHSP
jgi:site-specific recombinase XerD